MSTAHHNHNHHHHLLSKNNFRRIRIIKPVIRTAEEERLWREVHKFAELIPFELEPNMGRVREIKDELKKGTYMTQEIIEETAARLAVRFLNRD